MKLATSCLLAAAGLLAAAAPVPGTGAHTGLATPLPDGDGRIAAAVRNATAGLSWLNLDMHLHTDHSSDAGVFHQQEDTPQSHDTFLDEQRDQAARMGMGAVAFTDHRSFDQHFDPEYATSGEPFLMTGQEWGGARHGTAFAITEVLEHDGSPEACGLAQASFEAAAQDALLGIAHPKDANCLPDLVADAVWPLSHVEALRGGDNALQEAGFPTGGNGSNSAWYAEALAAGWRLAAVNGSDNHFKQVWPGPSGPGGSSAHLLVRDASQAGVVEAIRAGRTVAGWGATAPRVTTLLDADGDGAFDAVTGGWARPRGDTVTVAFRVEQAAGHHLQVFDDTGAVVAEDPVALPDQTLAYDLPADRAFYRAQIAVTALTQVGFPDPLDYADTLVAVSTPVWTSAPRDVGEVPAAPGLRQLSHATWSGFPDLARVGDRVHAVWQERQVAEYTVVTARSEDGGRTWSTPVPLSTSGDARHPAVAAEGERVTVAWERHDPGRLGGDLVVATSWDGGATFDPPEVVAEGNTRGAALAAADGVDHLVWSAQSGEDPWTIHHARRTADGWSDPVALSSAVAVDGPTATYAVPPRTIRHVPASVDPDVAVRDGRVLVAWEDDRDDPTPLRSGTPDDWAIFAAVSSDGGASFGPDARVSPRHLARDEPTPEGVEGSPARNVDTAVLPDGTLVVAYQDPFPTGRANLHLQRSADGTAWDAPITIAPPSDERSYRTVLTVDGHSLRAVWQQADGPSWHVETAVSTDGGRSFGPASRLTVRGRFDGWPAVSGDLVAFVSETRSGFAVHAAPAPVGAR